MSTLLKLSLLFALTLGAQCFSPENAWVNQLGAQGVNLWNLRRAAAASNNTASLRMQDSGTQNVFQAPLFEERWFEQPLDHFSKNSSSFLQRYWVNDRHWKSGGPVFVVRDIYRLCRRAHVTMHQSSWMAGKLASFQSCHLR
jgi:hypothetical protein